MLPAKKHGGGKVMSFPHSVLAALSMFALVGGPGTGAAQPVTAEPTIIRIGAVVDQTGARRRFTALLSSWRQAK